MTTRRSHRMSRGAAERLLSDGPAAAGAAPDPLARLLAAAAAPGQAGELAGEEPAVTAFHSGHLASVTESRRGQMIPKSPLAKLLTTKALAGAIALCAGGGVAVAYTTGAFSAGGGAGGGLHVSSNAGSISAHGGLHAGGSSSLNGSGDLQGAKGMAHLCTVAATQVANIKDGLQAGASQALSESGLETALANPQLSQVLNNPAFTQLVSTVESKANVADYCGLLLRLPALPVVDGLANIPAKVLATIPVTTMAAESQQVMGELLQQLPTAQFAAVFAQMSAQFENSLPTGMLDSLPVSSLSALPAPDLSPILDQLSPQSLNAVLSAVPTGVLGSLPTASLNGLPVNSLAKLPTPNLGALLTQLNPTMLTSVLAAASPSTLTSLPTGAFNGLPAPSLGALPVGSLSKVLPQLSPSMVTKVLSAAPGSVLGKLPIPVLNALPASSLQALPSSVLHLLPAGALSQLNLG